MAVNLIVSAVTLLGTGYLALWALRPDLRRAIEAPKYRIAAWTKKER